VTVKPRLQLAVLHYPIYDCMKIDYYIGEYSQSELWRHFHRSLANFVRNFVIHSKSTNFNPEAVEFAEWTRIDWINVLTLFEALFENFVVDKVIVYLRDVMCVTRSQKWKISLINSLINRLLSWSRCVDINTDWSRKLSVSLSSLPKLSEHFCDVIDRELRS